MQDSIDHREPEPKPDPEHQEGFRENDGSHDEAMGLKSQLFKAAPVIPDYVTIKEWGKHPDKEDTIIGTWAEDGSSYEITCPPVLRDCLIALQNIAKDTKIQDAREKVEADTERGCFSGRDPQNWTVEDLIRGIREHRDIDTSKYDRMEENTKAFFHEMDVWGVNYKVAPQSAFLHTGEDKEERAYMIQQMRRDDINERIKKKDYKTVYFYVAYEKDLIGACFIEE
jgi:hypothetical protein